MIRPTLSWGASVSDDGASVSGRRPSNASALTSGASGPVGALTTLRRTFRLSVGA